MENNNILINLVTSIGSITVVGFLFWTWLNTKMNTLVDSINELKQKINQMETESRDYLRKDEYLRRDTQLETQLHELKQKIDQMPTDIVTLLTRLRSTP